MSMDDSSGGSTVVLAERYDPDGDRSVALHVVRLVAIASDRGPTELEPLSRSIDTDALNSLIDPRSASPRDGSVGISFRYEGYEVAIDADGVISLSELRGG